jgi:hypothetical protein
MPPQFQSQFIPTVNNTPPNTPPEKPILEKPPRNQAFLIVITTLLILTGVFGTWFFLNPPPQDEPETIAVVNKFAGWKTYRNEEYGFTFLLPKTWEGYSVVNSEWKSSATSTKDKSAAVEKGSEISIRNPKWTSQKPYQDIPIMIFTVSQWSDLQNDKFHIGAAPIGPFELGHNNKYVFALPARYNFAYPEGFEEVDQILSKNPLRTFNLISTSTPSTTSTSTSINAL